MGRGSSKAGGRGGGASIVRMTVDRRTGQIYKARRGEIIVSKDGRDLLVQNARRSDLTPGGVLADYSARVGGQWVSLPNANQTAMRDYALAALNRRR